MANHFIASLLKYSAPALIALILLFLAAGYGTSWPPSDEALSKHNNSIILPLDFAPRYLEAYEIKSRSYLIISDNPISSHTMTVRINEQGRIEVKTVSGGLISFNAILIILALITWWFWFKDRSKPSLNDGRKKAVL